MAAISLKQFVEAGVHFGHQTRRWNPKMEKFIYGSKHGIHIIDLRQTLHHLKKAYEYTRAISEEGKTVLFVGTKDQAKTIIQEEAERSGSFFITDRWLGGLLTNFETVRQSVAKIKQYEEMAGPDGNYEGILKKEALRIERKRQKLEMSLGGVKDMRDLPSAIFLVDCKKEHIAVKEARKLSIPIIAIVDTNCDPDGIAMPIPGNDDAPRAIRLFANVISTAILEGKAIREQRIQELQANQPESDTKPEKAYAADTPAEFVKDEKETEKASGKGKGASFSVSSKKSEQKSSSTEDSKPAHESTKTTATPVKEEAQKVTPTTESTTENLSEKSETQSEEKAMGNSTKITASLVKELREITGVGMMECKKALVETNGDIEAAKEHLRKTGQAKALKKSSRETKEGGIGMFITEDKKSGGLIKLACETDFVAQNETFQSLLSQLAQQANANGSDNFLEQTSVGGGESIQEVLHRAVAELGENVQFVDAKQMSTESGVVGGYVHTNGKVGVLLRLDTDGEGDISALTALAKDIAMHIAATQAEAVREDEIDPAVIEKEKEIFTSQARESGKPDNIIEKMIEGRMKKFIKEVCVLTQPFVKNPDQTIDALLKEKGKELGVAITLNAFAKFQF